MTLTTTTKTVCPLASTAAVRHVYREFARILASTGTSISNPVCQATKDLENNNNSRNDPVSEMRREFRRPLADMETIEQRLQLAQSRLSFLRMSSVKQRPKSNAESATAEGSPLSSSSSFSGGGTWVYRNGERLKVGTEGETTLRDGTNSRVISPYDGKNLDPESVTRHKKSLRRAGFTNNSHAKGIF